MENGSKKIRIPQRCRFGVVAAGEFLVYGIRSGKRVALLGPSDVGTRQQRWEFRDTGFSHVEVITDDKTEWTPELIELSDGKEILDPTPVAVPVVDAPPTLSEQVKALVQHELSTHADQLGFETFEEADDFEVDDDEDWVSPYEIVEMEDDLSFIDSEEPETGPTDPAETPGNGEPPSELPAGSPAPPSDPAPAPAGSHPLRRASDLPASPEAPKTRRSTPS